MRNRPVILTFALVLASALLGPSESYGQTAPVAVPWASRDIGGPALTGSSTVSSGTYTIRAAGADIWGTSDQFHFVYQTLTGDGEILARVGSLTNAHAWAKAGVMMRESLAASSKHAFALVSAANGVALQQRATTGGSSRHLKGTSSLPPRWVRLVRKGSTYQAYESGDGQTWRFIGGSTITMASTIYVGLAVTSHNTGVRTTASISNVRVTFATANQLPSVSLNSPAAGSSYTSPAIINLQASAADADGTISKVDFFSGSSLIGSDASAPYAFSWTDVPAGSYSLTAVATDNLGGRATSSARAVTVSSLGGPVSAPWSAQDVGNPTIAGSAAESGGTLTIKAAGRDIWGTTDQFHFVYQLLTGDGEIVARVRSVAAVHVWSKAGIMMRESLAAGSKHAIMFASGSSGLAFQRRTITGSTTAHTAGSAVNAPYWVRLVRRGDVFEAFESADGQEWEMVGTTTISMPPTIYVGLAVTSCDVSIATTAVFSDVTVSNPSTNQPPAVALTGPANGATYTAPATVTMSATATDADGTIVRVDFYHGSTLIASDATSPYSASWSNAPAATYTLTAVATDDSGDTTTSSPVTVTVNSPANQPPSVALTSPVGGASFSAPTTIALIANASDPDGSVVKVDFYAGTALIASDTTSPYSATWTNAAPGSYGVTAVATDNGGGRTTSAAVTVTVKPSQAVFVASVDHSTLASYLLEVFTAGADPATAMPVATRDLGKPTPANGEIIVDITSLLQPLAAGGYFATVSAVGAGGSTRSAGSATFSR